LDIKWLIRFLAAVALSTVCMAGALGSRYPLSVVLIYMGKGIWILFFIWFFGTGIAGRERRG
jgi:hypothetical protein